MSAKPLQHRPFQRSQQNVVHAFVGFFGDIPRRREQSTRRPVLPRLNSLIVTVCLRHRLGRAGHNRPKPLQQPAGTRIRVSNGTFEGATNRGRAIGRLARDYRTFRACITSFDHHCASLQLLQDCWERSRQFQKRGIVNDGGSLCALLIRRQVVGHSPGQPAVHLRVAWARSRLCLRTVTVIFSHIVDKSRLVQSGASALVYHTLRGIV